MINKNFYHKDLIPFDIKKHLTVFIAKKSQKESSLNILIEKNNKKKQELSLRFIPICYIFYK